MTDQAPLLRARGVRRAFRRAVALDGVDVAVGPGESVAVLGPNGAGKTTLLRILAGVDHPTSGEVERPARGIAWVPQRPAVYPQLTTRENAEFFATLAAASADDVLEGADLARFADRRADRLSTGTLQRLNIACALVAGPRVLLLDEPTSTLSPDQRVRLWEWLAGLRSRDGLTVVFSTQSVDEAARHAGRCLVIAHGRVVFDGPPADLAARVPAGDPHEALQAAFMGLVAEPDEAAP
ncbi:MAG: ABC transporter ATP-binding protein [Thermoleophilia bacterium]|nr:ABC transporter ATP-binding protein [Thermoleophilia bacterium]